MGPDEEEYLAAVDAAVAVVAKLDQDWSFLRNSAQKNLYFLSLLAGLGMGDMPRC